MKLEVCSIITVLKHVFGNPLICSISSLCCNSRHLVILVNEINLEPLVKIIGASWPTSLFGSIFLVVQSSLNGGVITIPLRWGSDLAVLDFAIFYAKGFIAFWNLCKWINGNKLCFVTRKNVLKSVQDGLYLWKSWEIMTLIWNFKKTDSL